ncbi:Imm26 family immunity protein [Jiangella anatolica]|uniref:Uncharacterized protein n=1 Tax=Jiangella anatolica TaxID=2670374 RepID=A0A2W2C1D8_9ACTN|nr:Imm26 family immunity protein [Jiangella anatolica]PZF81777.1 hypothetical protein C1I92_19755 [Jiangella anatolica]
MVGDVFTIPLDDDRVGLGQVVGTYRVAALYLAVFDRSLPRDVAPAVAIGSAHGPLLFLALSFDAKIYAGHWTVIGRAPVDDSIELPAYKEMVAVPPAYEVVDARGVRRRPATDVEAASLPNRAIVAPVRVEKALRAHVGLEPWHEAYAELRPDPLTSERRIFG